MIPMAQRVTAPADFVGACAWFPANESLRTQFTVKDRFGEPVKAYVERHGKIGLPINCVSSWKEDRRTLGAPVQPFAMMMPPRDDEQARCIDESLGLMKSGRSHMVRAGTGRGKSYMGCAIAAALGLTTLIIVNKDDLMSQWREKALLKFTNLKPHEIGTIQGDVCDWKGKKVVLAMIHSLSLDKYGDELKDYFGLVIWDECHRVAADTFSRTAMMFNARLRLGLSANKDRSDGMMWMVEALIGPQAVVSEYMPITPRVMVWKSEFKIPTVVRRVQGLAKRVPIPHSPGKMGSVYKVMANDNPRNTRICEFVMACQQKDRHTVLFADTREHLDVLHHKLHVTFGIKKSDMGFYVGSLKKGDVPLAEAAGRSIVLATYAMCSEATDYPSWNAAAFCTPRSQVNQAAGRILREMEGKPKPVLFDIRDPSSDILEGYWYSRLKYYSSLKSEMVYLS